MRHTALSLVASLSLAFAGAAFADQKEINLVYQAEKAASRAIDAGTPGEGEIEEAYSNTTVGGPTFNRPVSCASLSGVGTAVAYHSQPFNVTVTGNYTFASAQTAPATWDGFIVLYQTAFNPAAPLTNCLALNDDGPGGLGTSQFATNLTAGTSYFLVTTGFANTDAGAFTNNINGPGAVNFGGGAPQPTLTITKAAPDGVRSAGPFTYVITVGNTGQAAAANVVVTDPLPAALTYLSNTCGASVAGNNMTWNIGELAQGATASCTISVQMTAGQCTGVTNTATVSATGVTPVLGTHTNAGGNAVVDGALSTGGTVGSPWVGTSTNFANPFCTTALCGSGGNPPTAGPRSPTVWAWFGGTSSLEQGTLQQTVNVPAGAQSVDFYFWPGLCNNGAADFIRLLVNGTERWRFDATGTCGAAVGYQLQSVPLNGVTGNTVIRFESTTGGGGTTNFNIDDVAINTPAVCSAPAPVAPTIAYNPTTGTTVAFTGVTTIGTIGNGTIVATPSGGIGTGAAATTTINTCTLGGTNPGSFAGAAAINLSFVGNTTTPQNLALTCTSQQTVQTATLTCLETRGVVAPPQVSGVAPNPAQRQWNLTCPAGTPVAPTIAYNPTAGSNVAFTGVTTIGTTGNGTIAATPSGGIGTGAGATTTINACTLGGTNPGSFAGAAAINLSFVGNTTTTQNLALTCTSQQTAQTATLTCNETRGSDAPVQRQWPLNCPAGTPVAPSIAYNPTTGGNVAFTGVTTIGTTGNGTIAATPSGGIGTGAPATTTINACTLGGTNPAAFAGAGAINLSFVGNTTTAQNLALTCTAGAAAQTATLTCNETRGAAAPVPRQWPLSCPAGTLLPLTSAPVSGSTVNVTGTAGGSTTTAPITLTNPNPIPVSLTCTAPAFPFTATPLVFSIPTGGNAPVTIGISPAAAGNYTGTLSCTIAGSPQVLTFNLAGTLVPAIAVNATSTWSLLALMLALMGFALVAVRRQS